MYLIKWGLMIIYILRHCIRIIYSNPAFYTTLPVFPSSRCYSVISIACPYGIMEFPATRHPRAENSELVGFGKGFSKALKLGSSFLVYTNASVDLLQTLRFVCSLACALAGLLFLAGIVVFLEECTLVADRRGSVVYTTSLYPCLLSCSQFY